MLQVVDATHWPQRKLCPGRQDICRYSAYLIKMLQFCYPQRSPLHLQTPQWLFQKSRREIRAHLSWLDLLQLMFYKGCVEAVSLHTETLILVHRLYWTAASGIKSVLSDSWQTARGNVTLAINAALESSAFKWIDNHETCWSELLSLF